MRLSKKFAAIAIATTLAVTATAAFALWSATGTGSGAATATNSQAITGSAVSGPANPGLYPNGPAVSVSGTLNNPNGFAVDFTGWSSAAVVSAVGCAASNFSIAAPTGTQAIHVAGSASASAVTLPGVVQMVSGAPDACQNAVVNVSFVLVGGTQSAL